MPDNKQAKILPFAAWVLAAAVSALAVIAWGRDAGWLVFPFNAYLWFPLLGLLAFSLMWTHYVMAAVRGPAGDEPDGLAAWFKATGWAVLVLICLHPGLLIYQRFADGRGLPPHSYETYVAPGLGWITLLGTASLLVFLAFELHRFYSQKPWWPYVRDASDLAMLAIVYHGLRLGHDITGGGWFQKVWWFYGLSLAIILIRKYALRLAAK